MHLIIDLSDDTDLFPVVFARNARWEQEMMGRVKRERWSSLCLTFLLPITPHTPLERDSERWLETSQVMILFGRTVGGLNGSWNVYLASPQISQGEVTLSPICQRHSLLHSRSFCLHAMLFPTNGCWELNHIPLEKSPYRKLGANTFQKMEAEMLHALHKTFIVHTT